MISGFELGLAVHERTEAFIHFGQGVLVKYATLHDTVTAHAFDVAGCKGSSGPSLNRPLANGSRAELRSLEIPAIG